MSSHANLLIGSGTSFDLYHYNGGSNVLYDDLFWGPAYAAAFIRSGREVGPSDWLDEVAAEGGAVMDGGRRALVWYGGEDIKSDVPLRRLYLRVMARLWPNWTVRWATGGVADLADYVGRPRASVLSPLREPPAEPWPITGPLLSCDEPYVSDTVVTARVADGEFRAALVHDALPDYLYAGPALAAAVAVGPWSSTIEVDWTGDDKQIGGCHLDMTTRTVDLWTASPYWSADVQRRVQACWPGWSVTWYGDRFESQLDRAADHLRIAVQDERDLTQRLRQTLLYPDQPWHRPSRLRLNARTRLFDAAVAALA